ncbi:hypothetical protein, partial [Streptomyces sp. NPDC050804]|uniref:hypothetical protein n=1 Tax=Streptomyces sp. NPDC050804 TaxID=3154745 RepID=UPI003448E6EC
MHLTAGGDLLAELGDVVGAEEIAAVERIGGPMNQKDSAATPMASAFTKKPDLTPFTALPNR